MKIFLGMFLASAAFAAKPVELKSSQLEVTFDPLKGLPVEYRLASNKATIAGIARQRRYRHHFPRQSTERIPTSRCAPR